MLNPSAVFTPSKPPVEQTNVYVARGSAQRDLQKSLERSFVPLIFGEYGVGKTSLARHAALEADRTRRLVNVESVDGKTFSQVLQQVLEHVGYTIQTSVTRTSGETTSTTTAGEAGIVFSWFSATLGREKTKTDEQDVTTEETFVVNSPSDSKVLDVCEYRRLTLLLDELHRATPEFLRELSSFIKVYHNRACKYFRILLVGTSSDPSRLIVQDPGIDRVIQEVQLLGMTEEESRNLVRTGMHKLNIDATDAVVGKIARTAAGSPSIVQFLALEVADAAFGRTPRIATELDVVEALNEYMNKRVARLRDQYMKAIETTGDKRYRKRILHAMAHIDDEYVTMDQLVERVSRDLGESAPNTALSGPLRALKSVEYGSILRDVNRNTGQRVFNYSAFTDPAMKAFIRMREVADEDQLRVAGLE